MNRMFDLFPRPRERAAQFAGTLSGGEQQMLAISGGMMARPSIVVLDEPSLGLAPRAIDEIFRALSQIRTTNELGILLVKQNVRAALNIADRGYVLERGAVVTTGMVAERRADPSVQGAYLGSGHPPTPHPTSVEGA